MSNLVWPGVLIVLFISLLVGCGGDDDNVGERRANPAGPAPLAGGTVNDDAAQDRVQIPTVPTWEEFVKEHAEKNDGAELPEPRTRDELHEAQERLPRLFLTHDTWTRVIVVSGNMRPHRDSGTGEMCSAAQGCYNPDCPGRGEDGEPFGFIAEGRNLAPQPVDDPSSPGAEFARDPYKLGVVCPACIKIRDLASETTADRERYARWIHAHELPENRERIREITEERRRRIAWERAHR